MALPRFYFGRDYQMTVQRVESAAAMFTTPIILELELLRLRWTAGPPSTSFKKRMPRPVCKGIGEIGS
jgi:hypothetical protein